MSTTNTVSERVSAFNYNAQTSFFQLAIPSLFLLCASVGVQFVAGRMSTTALALMAAGVSMIIPSAVNTVASSIVETVTGTQALKPNTKKHPVSAFFGNLTGKYIPITTALLATATVYTGVVQPKFDASASSSAPAPALALK